MCTQTGIKHVYWGVQGACPWRAVTHAGGTAECSERHAVGMGLKLVDMSGKILGPSDEAVCTSQSGIHSTINLGNFPISGLIMWGFCNG